MKVLLVLWILACVYLAAGIRDGRLRPAKVLSKREIEHIAQLEIQATQRAALNKEAGKREEQKSDVSVSAEVTDEKSKSTEKTNEKTNTNVNSDSKKENTENTAAATTDSQSKDNVKLLPGGVFIGAGILPNKIAPVGPKMTRELRREMMNDEKEFAQAKAEAAAAAEAAKKAAEPVPPSNDALNVVAGNPVVVPMDPNTVPPNPADAASTPAPSTDAPPATPTDNDAGVAETAAAPADADAPDAADAALPKTGLHGVRHVGSLIRALRAKLKGLESMAEESGDSKLTDQLKTAENAADADSKMADAEDTKKSDDEPPSAEDEEDGLTADKSNQGGCSCKCGCGGDADDDDDLTESEKKIKREKKARCRAKKKKRRQEQEQQTLADVDQQLLDAIAVGHQNVEAAFQRLQAPLDKAQPPPPIDPLEEITKAAMKLGAKIDPKTGYLEGFTPINPDDVISDDNDDQFQLEDACHKNCKCHKSSDDDVDDPDFDAIEQAISGMGDSVTDPKMKCTVCQFFVGKIDRMFSRAARNAPIFVEEAIDTSSDVNTFALLRSEIRKSAVSSFESLSAPEKIMVLAHVAAALVEKQAEEKSALTVDTKKAAAATTTTTKTKAKCPGEGCDGGSDDGIGSLKEEVEKAEEKGIEEGIKKEKEKVEEAKGELEPKEPTTPVKPPNRRERQLMIMTGSPPDRGATHSQWWLANDMFLNIKPLVFHKFQELCSTRVPGSFADFCQPLFTVYDDISTKLREGTGMFDICLSNSFCTDDLRPPSPDDAKGGASTPATTS